MNLNPPDFSTNDVEILKRETLYQGFFRAEKITLRHKLFRGGWTPMSREIFLRGEAVGALLYDPINDLIGLVEQFRVGALADPSGPWCLEIVAGMLEEGEAPEEVARRELIEEANIEKVTLEHICNYLPSPGGCNEKMHLYCALCDLSEAGGIYGLADEHEDIKVHIAPADEVFENLLRGRINNASALICLLWLQTNRPRLRSKID
jgi:ADP-ribose pyrophosphatase